MLIRKKDIQEHTFVKTSTQSWWCRHLLQIFVPPVRLLWASYEPSVNIDMWTSGGPPVSLLWASCEPLVNLCKLPVSLLWISYESPMNFLWISGEPLVTFLWTSCVPPRRWNSCGPVDLQPTAQSLRLTRAPTEANIRITHRDGPTRDPFSKTLPLYQSHCT